MLSQTTAQVQIPPRHGKIASYKQLIHTMMYNIYCVNFAMFSCSIMINNYLVLLASFLCISLTHLCLEICLTDIFQTFDTFEYKIAINHRFTKYLKESLWLGSDEYYSFKYFMKHALVAAGMNGLKDPFLAGQHFA